MTFTLRLLVYSKVQGKLDKIGKRHQRTLDMLSINQLHGKTSVRFDKSLKLDVFHRAL